MEFLLTLTGWASNSLPVKETFFFSFVPFLLNLHCFLGSLFRCLIGVFVPDGSTHHICRGFLLTAYASYLHFYLLRGACGLSELGYSI
jgi:hypothetical protein